MKKIIKMLIIFFIIILAIIVAVVCYFFIGKAKKPIGGITWGVDFSQSQAEYLKLNWKETYSAIIDDLGVKNIKLHTNWNWVEGKKDDYFFNDIDWQNNSSRQHCYNI